MVQSTFSLDSEVCLRLFKPYFSVTHILLSNCCPHSSRTKESVEFELGAKSRETILLDSGKVWNSHDESMRETIENCKEFTADIEKMHGDRRKEVLLRLYGETAILKANAVW